MHTGTNAVIRGRVHGTVQLRHTERGTPAARFTLVQIPREYDHDTKRWTDGAPVPVAVTVSGADARHAAECLTDAVHVIATGYLAIRDGRLFLDRAHVGVDLAHHVAYIDSTLPRVLAGATTPSPPQPPQPAAPAPAGRPLTAWEALTAPSRTPR